METIINKKNNICSSKTVYKVPTIERIKLDNEISLALESEPPYGPDETMNSIDKSGLLHNDPFKA